MYSWLLFPRGQERLARLRSKQGWGKTHVLTLNGTKVFVKSIPITDLEYGRLFSTKNLYHLPTFYNYGVGSAGFGAFRELVTHIKTTNWVLDGCTDNFPLMYHYRIVPCRARRPGMDIKKHKRYVEYWNNNKNIGRYTKARYRAKYEIILFLEYVPYVLASWLPKNMHKLDAMARALQRTLQFLRTQGIVHFDVHFWNIVTDGEIPYLTDFGLVLDKSFTLNRSERLFLARHHDYDYAEFLYCLGFYLYTVFDGLAVNKKKMMGRKYGIQENTRPATGLTIILDNLEAIHAENIFKLDEHYVKKVIRHRHVINLMNNFYGEMGMAGKKKTHYPHTKIRKALDQMPSW